MSQLNLPHGNRKLKSVKTEKTKSRKQICPEITVKSPGNPCSKYLSRKKGSKGYSGKDLQRRKVLSLEKKSEWAMEYQITVSMTVGR